jgi:hypothetical protein
MLISIDTLQQKTTDSRYVYYDCRGATVGDRGPIAWMPAYIAVGNLLSMILMSIPSGSLAVYAVEGNFSLISC